ncbi:MAG: hypothetical protein KDJ35_06915 [Alphaproteobacteria bacterium]|nr:hypothetical protein [Alphaproteobacteria bacterium]
MVSALGSILSAAQKSQLTAIQSTARLIDDVQLRLASGLEVNKALDDPQNFFSARALEFRASDLSRRLDGIRQNIRAIQETQSGIDATLETLDLAESYLVDIEKQYQAGEIELVPLGDPTNVTQFEPASGDFINYAGSQDSGGPVSVTNGGDDFTLAGNLWKRVAFNYTVTADTVLEFEYASTIIPEISAIGFETDSTFNNDSNRFFLNGTQFTGVTYAAPVATYQYSGGGAYQSYSIAVGTYFTGTFTHLAFINDDDSGPTGNALFRNVTLREGPIDNSLVAPPELQEGYELILDQMDSFVIDANYRGINLLNNENMETVFNEEGTSTLVTEGIDATSNGLGLVRDDFNSVEAVQAKIEQVRDARTYLRNYTSTIASDLNIIQTRDIFVREAINTLLSGSDDLVVADQNEKGAEFLALQTRQSVQFVTLALGAQSEGFIADLL